MKRILLVGQLGEIVRSINDGLLREFSVQICSEQMNMVQSMAKIVKPDMFIFCQIGIQEQDAAFFTWVHKEYPQIPVLVITTEEEWMDISKYCNSVQFEKFFRPVTIHAISEKCKELTSVKLLVTGGEETEDSDSKEVGIIRESDLKRRVLVVDDNPIVLRNVKSILDEKYETTVVPSGEKALLLIPKKKPDLILLDYEMKGMDGRQTFEAMLSDEMMAEIPVIFLTSVSNRDKVLDVLKSKPAGYILKPIDRERLFEEIDKVLNYV